MKKLLYVFLFLFGLGISINSSVLFAAENERAFGEEPESRDELKEFETEEDYNDMDLGPEYEEGDYEEAAEEESVSGETQDDDEIGDY